MSRLKTLVGVAGFLLILNAPAFAQTAAEPEETAQAPSDAAPNAQDESQVATQDSQAALTDSDWWGRYDDWSVGYVPGSYGLGSCRSWSQSTGRGAVQWWNAAGTNSWFPTGEQLPYPYGSGWCGNNSYANRSPYALWANQVVISTKKHRRAWNHKSNGGTNNQIAKAGSTKAPREIDRDGSGPDDDWTRVQDSTQVRSSTRIQRPTQIQGSTQRARLAEQPGLQRACREDAKRGAGSYRADKNVRPA